MTKKGLYSVTTGETYYVHANSREEAEAIYMVALGHADVNEYPQFEIYDEDLDDVEEGETDTIVEFITDLS